MADIIYITQMNCVFLRRATMLCSHQVTVTSSITLLGYFITRLMTIRYNFAAGHIIANYGDFITPHMATRRIVWYFLCPQWKLNPSVFNEDFHISSCEAMLYIYGCFRRRINCLSTIGINIHGFVLTLL